jgi:hypothetical protein
VQSVDQPSRWTLERAGGFAGLAFALSVLLQNAVLLVGNPLPDAGIGEIRDFYADNGGRISVAVGLVALNIVFLVFFGSAVAKRLEDNHRSRVAARAAVAGIVLLAGAFLTTTLLQAVLTARVDDLAAAGQLQLLWDVHTAAFAMSGSGLGLTLAALSIGALLAKAVVPKWTAITGLVGAAFTLSAGVLVVSTIDGGPGMWLQLIGFVAWLLWLIAASIGLLRSS